MWTRWPPHAANRADGSAVALADIVFARVVGWLRDVVECRALRRGEGAAAPRWPLALVCKRPPPEDRWILTSQMMYPVNTLRNIAAGPVGYDLCFLADVDFVPSVGLCPALVAAARWTVLLRRWTRARRTKRGRRTDRCPRTA